MRLYHKMRQQKVLSFVLVLATLAVGIVIGTLVNPRVHAARNQAAAPDATPLVIPNAVQLGNEFTKLAKKLEPSVVYITADYTPKVSETPRRRRGVPQEDEEGGPASGDEGLDLFKKFFNRPFTQEAPPRAFRQEQSGTGFIVDKNGYIITNNHVVNHVDRIKVKIHGDSAEYRAHVVGVRSGNRLSRPEGRFQEFDACDGGQLRLGSGGGLGRSDRFAIWFGSVGDGGNRERIEP